ncbi:MAG: DUF5723 family protein [Bacteroidota bacterium]
MKLLIYTIILIITGSSVYSQINDINCFKNIRSLYGDYKFETGASFNSYLSSNSVNNSLLYALFGNQYIDDAVKNRNHLKPVNLAGNEDNLNFYFCHIPDSLFRTSNIGYRIGFTNHNHRDMKFSDDLFNLVFYGNKQFAGDTADMSDFQINFMTYQELQFGIFKKHTIESGSLVYYVGFSFLKGQDYNSVRFRNANLFTAETGEYIDLNVSASYQFIDTVKSSFGDFNGLGTALNFYLDYEDTDNLYNINLSINNVGFIRWKNNAHTINLDTAIHFDGIEIQNIFEYDDSSYFGIDPDSIVTDFFQRTDTASFTKVLPERIHLSITKKMLDQRLLTTLGLGYYYGTNMKLPLFYAQGEYLINDNFSVSILTGYGEYSGFHLGGGLKLKCYKEKIYANMFSNNVLGFILLNNAFSQNIYAGFSYRF